MAFPVGCLTETTMRVVRTRDPMNVRVTVEQDWILHPTKGWRRGQKRKSQERVTFRDAWPRSSFKRTWKAYR